MSEMFADTIQALQSSQEGALDTAVKILSSAQGTHRDRLALATALAHAGDPRICSPRDSMYWREVDLDYGKVLVGRFPVTIMEWKEFVQGAAYQDNSNWSDEGLVWRDKDRPSWQELAKSPAVAALVVDNHPVVGVSWFEAQAYARFYGARLPDFDERIAVIRGTEKRHYPWGSPFGHGNCNTKEEALGQTCAVGMFVNDQTPDGVYDLVGNVAEWTAEDFDGKAVIHPGSWSKDMMSSWPKASQSLSTAARLDNLGFRLVKDI